MVGAQGLEPRTSWPWRRRKGILGDSSGVSERACRKQPIDSPPICDRVPLDRSTAIRLNLSGVQT